MLEVSGPVCPAKLRRWQVGYRVYRMHGARGGAPEGKHNGNYRHGQATNDARRRMAKLNYLGRMLRLIRREEKCVASSVGNLPAERGVSG